ncbi:MAG TPA: hypothetical protein VLT79_00275 [Gemmatimonadales bacterium]|nr:hypothetical protein [Gemmatimonadales bacterium]
MFRTAVLVSLTVLAAASRLPGQQKALPGDRVRVLVRNRSDTVVGRINSVTQDSVILTAYGNRRAVAKSDVARVDISRGSKSYVKTGAMTGAALGLVGGGIGGGISHSNCDSDCFFSSSGAAIGATALLFGTAGAAAGGLIGAMFGHEVWEPATF